MSRHLEHEESDVIDILLNLQETVTPQRVNVKRPKYNTSQSEESPLPLPSITPQEVNEVCHKHI